MATTSLSPMKRQSNIRISCEVFRFVFGKLGENLGFISFPAMFASYVATYLSVPIGRNILKKMLNISARVTMEMSKLEHLRFTHALALGHNRAKSMRKPTGEKRGVSVSSL